MNKHVSALILAILCMLFWGFSFISTKITVEVFPPMSIGALRFAMATVFLFVLRRFSSGSMKHEKLEGPDIPLLAGAGLSGVTLYFFFENNGLTFITASEASIITAAIPVLMIITESLGASLRRNKTRNTTAGPGGLRQWTGAMVSMIGVWLVARVSFSLETAAAGKTALGYICMAGAAVSWVVYSYLTRPLFKSYSQLFIVFWQSVFGFLGFLPFALLEIPSWGEASPAVICHLVFLGLFCSALAYWFYAESMKHLGISISSLFINLIPVITVIAGFFVLGERLSRVQWLGAALVLGGVYLALFEKRKK
ncbi:MAG: DMT family transporter [Treponema sp.]|jgi:drug/metabolite transporter (DMT)-like permease|nr:DMT family transporter [Treponema sp.]